ncbi:MAG: hypothetical protein IPK19_12255 [Chloroflexi bacterium]|nr:hypothetical protein [Chloroflexota bacterium]
MRILRLASVFLAVVLLACTLAPAMAHEGREVGPYLLTFGWRAEPATVGSANGPEVIIAMHEHEEDSDDHDHEHAENPLEGVVVDLQVEVQFGPASKTLVLDPVFGSVDRYVADLIPTRPGDYTFRVFGTIGDVEVDEVFSSADGEFSSVEPASDITFPDPLPSVVELMEQIAALEARIAALEGG